jgi:hypothetical protein
MVEPVTTVGLGAIAAYLSKDGVAKLLGPTADYLGGGLRDFAKERIDNIGKIFESAGKKLGPKLEIPGQVPPKVLKTIMNEGSYADNNIATEYFGGILASARTEHGRDDRSARIARTLDSLTTYQLRAHYLIYASIRKIFLDNRLSLNREGREKMRVFIPLSDYITAMDFNEDELAQFNQLLSHVFFGLVNESLIDSNMNYGPQESMVESFSGAGDAGIICGPSVQGAELFMSAFGYATLPLESIFDKNLVFEIDGVPDGFATSASILNT